MGTGESAAERARAVRATAARYEAKAERAGRVAAAYEKGNEGELAVARLLTPLATDGFHRLDDRAVPNSRGNIDHLLIGSSGVFVVDAKNWSGSVEVKDRTLRQNGRRRSGLIEDMRRQATTVADVLEEAFVGHRVPVRPVVAFVGEAQLGTRVVVERVHLLDGELLEPWVRAQPAVLSQSDVEAVLAHLLQRLPPRASSSGHIAPQGDLEAPDELVVFLEAWRKHGHHRLYVKDADGQQVGYLDLRSGTIAASSNAWETTLTQLLPHYLQGDTPGLGRGDLSDESRGAIRRFLDSLLGRTNVRPEQTIIACYHWRNYGKNRLYLHRLAPKGLKVSLGWFDLDGERLSAERQGADRILGYCGHRYLVVSQATPPAH